MDKLLAAIAPYHKLLAAIAGVILWVLFKRLGFTVPGMDQLLLDLLTGALLVGGPVYAAPANKPKQ